MRQRPGLTPAAGRRSNGNDRYYWPAVHGPRGAVVHDWRVFQLMRLGIPGSLAEIYADQIDWHQIARLVQRGCPPRLALRIAG
jgi:hypothetical protein